MGNCVSCNDQSSHEQPEYKLADGDRRNPELQSSTGVMSLRHSDGYNGVGTGGMESVSSGSRTPGGSSAHRIISLDGGSGPNSQKTEKKTFYSRIPPLGRSGSTDKKSLASNNATIKDNNNAYSESKIAALFDHYKDPQEDLVLAEGIEKLCKDLEVKPEDFKMLVLAWKFNAEQMCRFTREEFFQGMKELKTDTLQGVQARLPDIVTEVMSDPIKFKDLYRFSFKFGLDSDLGQRILPTDMAVSLWRVVFSQKEPEVLERWIGFLEAHSGIRGVPRDTWNMFLNFVETVGTDLSTYDDTEAWPSLFDDFVEYENDKLNQNTISVFSSSNGGTGGGSGCDKVDLQQVIENSINFTSAYEQNQHQNNSQQSGQGQLNNLLPLQLDSSSHFLLHNHHHSSPSANSNSINRLSNSSSSPGSHNGIN